MTTLTLSIIIVALVIAIALFVIAWRSARQQLQNRDREVSQLLAALAGTGRMTLTAYQVGALRTAPENQTAAEDLCHACAGIFTEGGELMDQFKKHQFYGKDVDLVNVREEIGDVLWYLAIACRAAGTTLDQVAEINLAKLRKRYPAKFSAEAAINRDVVAERAVLEAKPQPAPGSRVVTLDVGNLDAPAHPAPDRPAGDLLVVKKA